MKIIHCADLHIDVKHSKFSPEKRAIKRHQHLQSFVDMVDFAEKNQVSAILLCGDIFDETKVLKRSLKVVQDCILSHPNITFFHIWGNHDLNVSIFENTPSNYIVFGNQFDKIDFGDVCVGGVSFQRFYDETFYDKIKFEKEDFNILMLHGPINVGDDYSEPVLAKKLASKNIDYLALGHIHLKGEGVIDRRGIWAYSGCLEQKNFKYSNEEIEDFGFYLLDIKNKKVERSFVPFCKYPFRTVEVSVTGMVNSNQLFEVVDNALQKYGEKHIVRLSITGFKKETEDLNLKFIQEKYADKFFYFEIEDNSKLVFDFEKYANEKTSLKAEFIKEVFADQTLSEEERQQICTVGLEVLKGEDISL